MRRGATRWGWIPPRKLQPIAKAAGGRGVWPRGSSISRGLGLLLACLLAINKPCERVWGPWVLRFSKGYGSSKRITLAIPRVSSSRTRASHVLERERTS